MAITMPLDQMTTTEKLLTMENIWDDLCRKADKIPSPLWHKKILDQREENLQKRIDVFSDWEDAKKNIRESVL